MGCAARASVAAGLPTNQRQLKLPSASSCAHEQSIAECGGSYSCGTCHIYGDEAALSRLPKPDDNEEAIIDEVAAEVKPTRRLGCQIKVTAELNGLVVRVPLTQG